MNVLMQRNESLVETTSEICRKDRRNNRLVKSDRTKSEGAIMQTSFEGWLANKGSSDISSSVNGMGSCPPAPLRPWITWCREPRVAWYYNHAVGRSDQTVTLSASATYCLKQYSLWPLIGAGSNLVASDFDVGLCSKEFSVAFLWPAIRG